MASISTNEEVAILYIISHGKPTDGYSSADVMRVRRKYPVNFKDSRATKKNLTAYVNAKKNGYRKDFNDYCYAQGLADGRKTRNGKQDYNNSKANQFLAIGFLMFISYIAMFTYGMQQLFVVAVLGEFIIWKLLGKRRGIAGAVIFIIVFCEVAYHAMY